MAMQGLDGKSAQRMRAASRRAAASDSASDTVKAQRRATSAVERQARKALTAEQRQRGDYTTEWMAEADANGDTSDGLDIAVMRKVVPVPGLKALCGSPDFGPREIKASRMFHADCLASQGPASSQLRERVQESGHGAAGERAYLAKSRVQRILGGLSDIRSKPIQSRDHKGRAVVSYEFNGTQVARDVFVGRGGMGGEALSVLYPGRKCAEVKPLLMRVVERLCEEYGLV